MTKVRPLVERLAAMTMPVPHAGCILFTGFIGKLGYGRIWNTPGESPSQIMAHRAAWQLARGPIPKGLTIDHLCYVRCCVNVYHMEVVTRAQNTARARRRENAKALANPRPFCKRGHSWTSENIYVAPNGKRRCSVCHADRQRGRRL